MKKGKGLLWFLTGSILTAFVMKNEWCQKQFKALKEKGESVLGGNKNSKEGEESQADTEEKK